MPCNFHAFANFTLRLLLFATTLFKAKVSLQNSFSEQGSSQAPTLGSPFHCSLLDEAAMCLWVRVQPVLAEFELLVQLCIIQKFDLWSGS